MTHALKPRRRGVVLFYAILATGVAALVALPALGLWRINRETERSHDFTRLTGNVEHLTTGLLQLVTGPLARYGATGDPAHRESSLAAITEARATMAAVSADDDVAQDLGLFDATSAQLTLAEAVLSPSETFIGEIDAGATTATAPSTEVVLAAASDILQSRSAFATETKVVAEEIDASRRATTRDAVYLLGAGVAFELVVVFALGLLNRRRIGRVFVAEAARSDRAERLAAHRADVVSMASHELRNPLTALTLTSGLLMRTAESGDRRELQSLAEDAHTAALRCDALVNELLDLGRLDADRLQLKTGATSLRDSLTAALAMSVAHHGPRDVRISGNQLTPVSADPDRLKVILRNLVDNAFKYSPADSDIFISISQFEDRVRIDVQDEGAGVPEEFRERIFERFERLGTPGHASGVGIGLFLSRELARKMNGDIRCEPSERGARFELELPVVA